MLYVKNFEKSNPAEALQVRQLNAFFCGIFDLNPISDRSPKLVFLCPAEIQN